MPVSYQWSSAFIHHKHFRRTFWRQYHTTCPKLRFDFSFCENLICVLQVFSVLWSLWSALICLAAIAPSPSHSSQSVWHSCVYRMGATGPTHLIWPRSPPASSADCGRHRVLSLGYLARTLSVSSQRIRYMRLKCCHSKSSAVTLVISIWWTGHFLAWTTFQTWDLQKRMHNRRKSV